MRWRSLLWPLLCAVTVFAAVAFPLTNTDIWWHLASGRWILHEGRLPHVDPFATDVGGMPWVNLHWLFQIAAYGIHELWGVVGLVLVKAAMVAVGAALLVVGAGRAEGQRLWPLTALLVAGYVYLVRYLVLARPVVFTLLALAVFFVVLERFRHTGRWRGLLWLLPVQVLWANSQGGLQLLGPAVVAAYLLGEAAGVLLARRPAWAEMVDKPGIGPRELKWLGLLLLALGVCLVVTPYGIDGLALPFRLLGRIAQTSGADLFSLNVSENVPPWLLERGAAVPLEVWTHKWVAVVTFCSFAIPLLLCGSISVSRLLLVMGLWGLSLTANRNILLFNWMAGPVTAINVAPALARMWIRWSAGRCAAYVAAFTLAGLAAMGVHRYLSARSDIPLGEIAPFRVPLAAVAKLERFKRDSPGWRAARARPISVFSSVRYGGYLIWKLYPQLRPSMDGRLVLRSAARFADYLDLLEHPRRFDRYSQRRRMQIALVPSAMPDRYLPLAVHLYSSRRWRLVDSDGTEMLFVRDDMRLPGSGRAVDLTDSSEVKAIAERLRQRWQRTPAVLEKATIHFARLLAAVDQLEQSERLLRDQTGYEAQTLRARVLHLLGKRDQARRIAERLVASNADDVNNVILLARLHAEQGRIRVALDLLAQALDRSPHSPQVRQAIVDLRRLMPGREVE